jgi:rare lipoprotein A
MGQPEHWCRLARVARLAVIAAGCLTLANCGSPFSLDPKLGVSSSPRVVEVGDPVPKGGGTYRLGKPYTVAGVTYVPQDDPNYRAEGLASHYGPEFHGRLTANGEVFDMESLSAAHPTLSIPSYVRVTNLKNHKSVIVRINDRGPYAANRIIDVSRKTAHVLGFHDNGLARVRVEYVGPASLDGADDRLLLATLREGEPAPSPSRVMLASMTTFLPPERRATHVPLPAGRPFNLGEPQEVAAADVQAAPAPASSSSKSKPKLQTAHYQPSQEPKSLQDQAHDLGGAGSMAAYAPVSAGYQQTRGLNQRALY